ncbi:PD-(D/E)XK nuclease family protein [Prevotella copri]|uniref:PD-(D/E)XK nuclease family protein n=1 Tax=Segatella copri TaxID=165179 RepID=A0AAW4MZ73_9BACT|nr:PD-(D/E)XK nuclease family protein [Segatella copri]MBU9907583.1 PD-(D/E)XK nuclease family protein [Segatella copri]MBV3373105.1 PD-(D/E)XK nuclease family protein [Segatella copri]MBV3386261.1 PD-(D/E)XK nuclease family protein [Segatella copri]MBV3394293.1 PD-(D/E)XK nuclease family protein [Segatella copri]MBV3404047.1 PD-(D/E)XK nuclease family protein [Segatella copri]
MKTFLKYVARDILEKYGNNLSDIAIVFPNKRAALFLNESLARLTDHPIWSPSYITISDLFRKHSTLKVGDPIKLVCDLHKTFVACTGIDETLDHFYGWGQLLITDFDDIDKNMAEAEKLFANLSDIHELDDISYLTEEQKMLIRKFFSNFNDDHNSELKKRFLQLWSHFLDIYQQFNQRLEEQGLAYEGALYRKVVNDENIKFQHKKYLFVGFNMMQVVEQKLCERLMKEGKAHFYWDYDDYYMQNNHEAGHYIREYLKYFPNELNDMPPHDLRDIYHNFDNDKDITYISASTENIQARYVNQWLKEKKRYKCGKKVAIVLADEGLLQSVIHSLPTNEDIKSLPDYSETDQLSYNITLGYPLQQTPFYSLLQHLINLQGIGHPKHSNNYRLHYVLMALRHPYTRYISQNYSKLLSALDEQKQFYPTRQFLSMDGDEGLSLLFKDLGETATENEYNLRLIQYLLEILKTIGVNSKEQDDPLFQESLFRTYTLLNRLQELIQTGDLAVDCITLERLMQQLIQSTSIPFHGEPAEGIQVMGVLETRNLDFEHILVLSCNEGKLPKGVNDASFIPYSLRKAYGLTTVDNKVAIYAYYFHSLLQRSRDITLCYNNATEDGQSGEMSRFMLQLLVESHHDIKRSSLVAGQSTIRPTYDPIEKKLHTFIKLKNLKMLTPTFLNTYLRCEKQFYYKYVEGLIEPDEIDEDEVDNKVFGNIFHRAAELFYQGLASNNALTTDNKGKLKLTRPIVITKEQLEQALKDESLVYRLVDQAFREELFKVSAAGYHPKYNGLQLINKEVIARYIRQLITIDMRQAPFTILGLELVVKTGIEVETSIGKLSLTIGGFIDRLDAVAANGNANGKNLAERIRVIDYKTGRISTTHPRALDEVFNPSMLNKHTDYYLQSMLYSIIVKHNKDLNPGQDPVSPGLLFIQNAGAEDYDPTLKMGKELISSIDVYEEEFMKQLKVLIANIFDKDQPFRPTDDKHRCEYCPYAALCKS